MSFVSLTFVAVQLLALLLRVVTRRLPRARVVGLVALSWVFYAWSVPAYLVLILFSTTVAYVVGRLLAATPPSARGTRRGLLSLSLALNLGVLAYFKYAAFLTGTWTSLAGGLGLWSPGVTTADILLPLGISFFTFESISYTVDVYRGRIAAERSFARLACFIAFFPRLVAGPIVRAGEFLYQLERPRRLRLRVFAEGTYLVTRGLFLKMVVADNLGEIVDRHWTDAAEASAGPLAASLLVFFACQLLCDFAGYTDIARGLAYQLGIRLPVNFDAPHLAASFSEFWRRWHITLSRWMRDYVYVPLGGNRRGAIRVAFNLVLVMLVSGLWHGASWTFVAWGAIHGVAIVVERALGLARSVRPAVAAAAWYLVVQATWILSLGMFRADDVGQGWDVIRNALAGLLTVPSAAPSAGTEAIAIGWWFVVPVVVLHVRALATERRWLSVTSPLEKAAYAGAMSAAIVMLYTTGREFIYFQF